MYGVVQDKYLSVPTAIYLLSFAIVAVTFVTNMVLLIQKEYFGEKLLIQIRTKNHALVIRLSKMNTRIIIIVMMLIQVGVIITTNNSKTSCI